MFTIKDLETRYGVTTHTVLQWISRGDLKAINVGRRQEATRPRWRISPDALAEFELLRAAVAPMPKAPRRRRSAKVRAFY